MFKKGDFIRLGNGKSFAHGLILYIDNTTIVVLNSILETEVINYKNLTENHKLEKKNNPDFYISLIITELIKYGYDLTFAILKEYFNYLLTNYKDDFVINRLTLDKFLLEINEIL